MCPPKEHQWVLPLHTASPGTAELLSLRSAILVPVETIIARIRKLHADAGFGPREAS